MTDEMADVVYPVLAAGIRLKQRVLSAAKLSVDDEQKELKNLLTKVRKVAGHIEGLAAPPDETIAPGRKTEFALTCWLDEIFTEEDVPEKWRADWENKQLEVKMPGFGTGERAIRFWDEAEKSNID